MSSPEQYVRNALTVLSRSAMVLGGVVPLVAHPGRPAFQVVPVEVVEGHVGAFDVLVIGQVVEEAFQADPVGHDRFR
jgi:hypothetical protein